MAILAMVVFHFTFDLMYFGYIKAGTVFQPDWRMFERSIAITFLFLAGLSWQHTHRAGIKWLTVWRRVALLGTAAMGISIVTYFTFGPYMIRFGILHLILGMSLLPCPSCHCTGSLRWPVLRRLDPISFGRMALFRGRCGGCGSSGPVKPRAVWITAPSCPGVLRFSRAWRRMPFTHLNAFAYHGPSWGWLRPFAFAGRHSLAIYLIHQPILFAGFNIYGFFVV